MYWEEAEDSLLILGFKISFTLYLDKFLFDKAQVTWSVSHFHQQNPLLPWTGVQFRMATVTLTAEIMAWIVGEQCNYSYTTPHFHIYIEVVSSTCSLPSAMKKSPAFDPLAGFSPRTLWFSLPRGSWLFVALNPLPWKFAEYVAQFLLSHWHHVCESLQAWCQVVSA